MVVEGAEYVGGTYSWPFLVVVVLGGGLNTWRGYRRGVGLGGGLWWWSDVHIVEQQG